MSKKEDLVDRSSFDLKYRPPTLDDLVGQDSMVFGLKKAFEAGFTKHSILFCGPSGCGKTTTARIVANMLGCHELSLFEYNVSKMRGIDTAREIIDSCTTTPLYGKIKVFILNEVHKATNEFQNAMLEILEEPPKHVYFILCTTQPEKLLDTVRKRCDVYTVTQLGNSKIKELLSRTLVAEKYYAEDFANIIDAILSRCDGSARVALKMLERVINIESDEEAIKILDSVQIAEFSAKNLIDALVKGSDWKEVSKIIRTLDLNDVEGTRYAILGYVAKIQLSQENVNDRLLDILSIFSESMMYSRIGGFVGACALLCNK